MNLDKILSGFKKTQAQLNKYIDQKTDDMNRLESEINECKNEKQKALVINSNLSKLLGEE